MAYVRKSLGLSLLICAAVGEPLGLSSEECEKLIHSRPLLRSNVQSESFPPWSRKPPSSLLVEQDLSSLYTSVHHAGERLEESVGTVKRRAELAFDSFVQDSQLAEELTASEQEVFRERFALRMQLDFACSTPSGSWDDVAGQALEREKPRLTKALAQHMFKSAANGSHSASRDSPSNVAREHTTYDWCDCKTGLDSVIFWSDDDPSNRILVTGNSVEWLTSKRLTTTSIKWICNGMSGVADSRADVGRQVWSLQLYPVRKSGFLNACNSLTGRIRVNTWSPTEFVSSVPFSSNNEGYACMKIPALLRTNQGSLLAFAEARTPNCSDFAKTDLVYKRSIDGGRTWSPLGLVVKPEVEGVCGASLVVGNAAPVQLSASSKHHAGRILLPHTLNNFAFWITHSDDDGITWSPSAKIPDVTITDESPDCSRGMTYYGYDVDSINWRNLGEVLAFAKKIGWGQMNPYDTPSWRAKMKGKWQFMGLGPPGSVQLQSGRVLVPGYHSWMRGLSGGNGSPGQLPISQLYNNLAVGHLLVSDDDGDTWQLRSPEGFGNGQGQGANEDQMLQLRNGSVLVNSRSFATGTPQYRVQARSDDDGETFTPTRFVYDLPEPFNGCQGSFVRGASDVLYLSHPNPSKETGLVPEMVKLWGAVANLTGRDHMTIFASRDGGDTYPSTLLIDSGPTGYSSLQAWDGKLGLLYEQADPDPFTPGDSFVGSLSVEVPTRFVFRDVLETKVPDHRAPSSSETTDSSDVIFQ